MAACSSTHCCHIFHTSGGLNQKGRTITVVNSHVGLRAGRFLIGHGNELKFKRKVTRENLRNRIVCVKTDAESPALSREEQESIKVSSKFVLVVGGTGGVGQLVVARLLDRGVRTRALVRDPEKAETLFGKQDSDKLQILTGDTRHPEELIASVFEGVTDVICCTGTTAFPSKRWDGDNTLKGQLTSNKKDWDGIRNLVAALPSSVKRFVLVSSVGVTKFNKLPWSIMNLFGVLKFKKMGEDFLQSSGIAFTIIRPGRLTDGPYTSYDLNTLLKATAGTRRAVLIGQGDELVGEASRIDVAEACIQALYLECTIGQTYEINSVEGVGPGTDPKKWEKIFRDANLKELNA